MAGPDVKRSAVSKLALGTAQFGLPYGIANATGQVTPEEANIILATASAAGLDTLDTAIAYGDSESTLGRLHADRFGIITKLPPVPEGVSEVGGWIRAQVSASIERLRVGRLEGLLLHRPDQLLGQNGDAIYRELVALRDEDWVTRIGVSVYDPVQLEELSALAFDLVQAPLNVFDQRMLRSGWLGRLKARGTAFHARSAFLQGLLLMPPDRRPSQFSGWSKVWTIWDDWLRDSRLTALQACLRFPAHLASVERVVVGVDSNAQFQSILAAADGPMPDLPGALAEVDPFLLNPANWSKH